MFYYEVPTTDQLILLHFGFKVVGLAEDVVQVLLSEGSMQV